MKHLNLITKFLKKFTCTRICVASPITCSPFIRVYLLLAQRFNVDLRKTFLKFLLRKKVIIPKLKGNSRSSRIALFNIDIARSLARSLKRFTSVERTRSPTIENTFAVTSGKIPRLKEMFIGERKCNIHVHTHTHTKQIQETRISRYSRAVFPMGYQATLKVVRVDI